MNARRAREILVFALAASAGTHAALAPPHAAEGAPVPVMFAFAAAGLAATAVLVDRSRRTAAYSLAALLLGGLLAAYAVSRVATLWPLAHPEPIDGLGAATKLFEAAGLLLALRLLQGPAGSVGELSARHQGAGP